MKRRRSHIFEKEKRGHYVEPSWCSRRLFEVEDFGPADKSAIYDPACGWGTITASAAAAGFAVFGSDIVDRRRHKLSQEFFKTDFLTVQHIPHNASIVCNPPFDHVQEFCEHAVKLGALKVAMICLLRRLNAAHWLQELPLRRVWLLTPRPSMPTGDHIRRVERGEIDPNTGEPCVIGGGTQDFCWLVFDLYSGAPRTIDWLHRDRKPIKELFEMKEAAE